MRFQNPKGTNDFYPQDMATRNAVFDAFLRVAKRHNFSQVESPAFESLALLSEKEGDEIKEEIFVLEQRGEEKFGLRFDLTVPLARMFLQTQKESPKPVKWCYATRMWRYERPQKGREREFFQMGVELYGSACAQADAEIIAVAIETLKELGLKSTDFMIRLSNRKLIQGLLQDCVKDGELDALCRLIDKRDKLEPGEFRRELQKLADPDHVIKIIDLDDLKEIGKLKMGDLAKQGFDELKAVYDLLDPQFVRISLSLVRGLAYYTGVIFEVFDIEKKYRAAAGGGRYDDLIGLFGGEPTPATGMAIGFSTLSLILAEAKLLPKPDIAPEYYVAPVDDTVRKQAWDLCTALRKDHSVEIDLVGRSLGKQLAFAGSIGAKNVIVVGPKDLKAGMVTVRNMASGKEEQVPLTDLL